MRWGTCEVCGSREPVGPCQPYENLHHGYCVRCGHCLGRVMKDPVTKTWAPEPPHSYLGNAYYREAVWGPYYCPNCGEVEEASPVPLRKHTNV